MQDDTPKEGVVMQVVQLGQPLAGHVLDARDVDAEEKSVHGAVVVVALAIVVDDVGLGVGAAVGAGVEADVAAVVTAGVGAGVAAVVVVLVVALAHVQ